MVPSFSCWVLWSLAPSFPLLRLKWITWHRFMQTSWLFQWLRPVAIFHIYLFSEDTNLKAFEFIQTNSWKFLKYFVICFLQCFYNVNKFLILSFRFYFWWLFIRVCSFYVNPIFASLFYILWNLYKLAIYFDSYCNLIFPQFYVHNVFPIEKLITDFLVLEAKAFCKFWREVEKPYV